MKVALVSLPKNEFRYPPIGLLRIATYIKNNVRDIEVRLIDNTFEDIYHEIDSFSPDFIGITTFTSYYQEAIDFAKIIKSKKSVKIIIGGPHITTLPESFNKIFDFGILGEGEETIVELIDALKMNKNLGEIKGLVYYKKDKLIENKERALSPDLDSVHKINYNFLNKRYFEKKFIPEIGNFGVSLGMMTSVGCPFNCRFCSIKACWRTIRFRKISSVVEEIKDLYYRYGVRHIDFFDDLFSINKVRLTELYEKLKKEELLNKLTFSCQGRANMIDDEMCKILKKLNIKAITFGFESGSDKVLKYIKSDSNISVNMNKNAIVMCKKYRINIFGVLMMGIPTETVEDMQKTISFIDFARKMGALKIWTQILVPLPATEIWEIAKKRGKIKDYNNNWKDINIHNRKNPLLLDENVPYEDFLKKYALAKKKCRFFVYRLFLKTLINNPLTIFYFTREGLFYIKRLLEFLKQ
ncbi:MAG: B12-binding domain-containing radical SAM protein [Nanoarchaeota archaeon]|nr:B12-binding domain-containing radical SAM protein [Nanoarchaeota archaeon]MBU4086031.1 B12-binding domain-containing radical SAM protein [Nanoarchaeota archaeon]